ncbi:hypothetical protein PRZ48_006425 [Zasmidium cellare]|uniref:Phospholipase/carboxylesterase/thioesterase domain-containing protein n=1 Tax=Zasmidium cellare TaxID=395010 RepID=A0ABR0EP84_ZASCE|nr:hypothetical protein PRZ48_006425 [Zasmidium cellare]
MASSTTNPKIKPSTPRTPPPFIVPPTSRHKQTLILLHGRGSTGEMFGRALLQSPLSNNQTLQTAFPNAKFIFPTAAARRAKWYNRALINEWFDSVPIDEQDTHKMSREEEEWQIEGLRESGEVLRGIIREEVEVVGAGNVVLGGLSQGFAMALWVLLGWDEGRLGGFVGMSGWLPFAGDVEGILKPVQIEEDGEEGDPFATSGSSNASAAVQVCNYVRDQVDLSPIDGSREPLCLDIPVFLGHGTHDDKVKAAKGRKAAEILRAMGVKQVAWKEYDEGHWYKVPDELDDIVQFLGRCFSVA